MRLLRRRADAHCFAAAAAAEIAGCFAFWAVMRNGASQFGSGANRIALAPTVTSRAAPVPSHGGIYITVSLIWYWRTEGNEPDLWNIIAAGATIILYAPRAT